MKNTVSAHLSVFNRLRVAFGSATANQPHLTHNRYNPMPPWSSTTNSSTRYSGQYMSLHTRSADSNGPIEPGRVSITYRWIVARKNSANPVMTCTHHSVVSS